MLPKNLKYGSKVESAVARSFRTNIAPQNGTGPYGLGDTIIINIPTRANLVLATTESYLKFKCAITSTINANNFRLDSAGIHNVIQRIRVFSGSNLLEDIDSYGMLAKMMFDLQVPTDSIYGKYNATSGTRNDLVSSTPPSSATFAQQTGTLGTSCFQTNSGELIGSQAFSAGLAVAPSIVAQSPYVVNAGQTVSDVYCINLISIVGSLCSSNYLPLFACTSAPLRVEIQLVGQMQNFVNQSLVGSTMAITNCEYIAQFIELGDEAMRGVYGSLGAEPLQLVMPEYRNYQYNAQLISSTSTQINMPIPAKFSSLKSILISCRDKGTGAVNCFPTSSVSQGIQQYQFRLGSQVVPSKPPDTLQEMFEEVIKAVGSVSDLQHQPSIEKFSYQMYNSINSTTAIQTLGSNAGFTVTVDGGTSLLYPLAVGVSNNNSGSFYVGLDLENYCAASKEGIFSGYNSNTDDIFWVPIFQTVTTGNPQMRFDAFACFDQVVIFQDGTAFVKF